MSRHKGKPGSDSDDDSRESLRGAENASTSDDDSENSDSDKSNPTDTESGSSVASDSSSSSDEGAGTPIIGKKKKEVDSDSDSDSDSEEDDVSKLRGLELFDDEEGFGISTGSRRRSSVSMRISHKRRAVLEEKAGLMDENAKDALKLDEDRYSDSSDSSFEIPDSEDDDDSDSESGGNDDDVDGEDGIGDHEKTVKKKLEGTGEKVKAGKADFAAKREARFALPEYGVPLETLQAFAKVAKDIAHSAKRPALSTKQLVREVILPLCALHKCSFVDLLCGAEKGAKARNAYVAKKKEERKNAVDSKVKATANALAKKVVLPYYPVGDKKYRANVFVSHSWNNKFVAVVDALESFHKEETTGEFRTTDKRLFFWIDIFCLNQWRPIVGSGRCPPRSWFITTFPEFLAKIGWTVAVMLPWNKPVVLHRTWCLYEIVATQQNKSKFSVAFESGRHNMFLDVLSDHYERAKGVMDSLAQEVNVDYSGARSKEAQESIFESVFEKIDHGSTVAVNQIIGKSLHTWSRLKTVHKLEIKFNNMRRLGEKLRRKNRGSIAKIVRTSLFCTAFGCVEAFDHVDAIRDNDVALLTLAQFIGRLYLEQEIYDKAEEYYRIATQGSEKMCGSDSPSTMTLLGNIAVVYKKQGNMKEAEAMFRRCLARKEQVLGNSHESTLGTVLNIASFLREIKRYTESIQMYKRAMLVQEEQYGENHEATLKTVEALASVYLEMGSTKDTLGLLLRILTSKTIQMGTDHPDTLTVLENVADMYLIDSEYDLARDAYTKALRARERVFGRNHPGTLTVYNNLALLEEKTNNYGAARTLYDAMIEGVIKTLGRTHFRVYMIMDKQITCDIHTDRSSNEKVNRMTYELFSKAENILTIDDPVTQTIAQHLGDSLVKLKRYKEASIYYRKSYDARVKVLGEDADYTLVVQYNLAYCLAMSKNFKEAYMLLKDLILRLDEHPEFGPEHAKTIAAVKSYIDVCKISGDKSTTETLLRRLHLFYSNKYGHEHDLTLSVVSDLASSYVGAK